jgi:DNA-binding beta-propeller fold protein YncE
MVMRTLLSSTVVGAVVAALLAGPAGAVPCGPATCAPLSVALPGTGVLLVRPHGLAGPLTGLDTATGARTAAFRGGVLSADGRRFVVATPAPGGTRVARFDAASGRPAGSLLVRGTTARAAAVSATGRFAALERRQGGPVAVVDLDRRSLVRTVALRGAWQVDAVSNDGRRLYLLEYGADGSYRVRLHLAGRGLVPGPITDPTESEPMTGLPWTTLGTPDGRRQLTLFLKAEGRSTEAFVHDLSIARGTAACIDLSKGDMMALGRYALVLSPDGRTLYAANPSLGRVQSVDLGRRRVVSTVRFAPMLADESVSSAFGTVSRDGRRVFFSGGLGLNALDTRTGKVAAALAGEPVKALGLDRAGRTLLVVGADGSKQRLDARTLRPVRA